MAFDDLSDRLRIVADSTLSLCRNRYGVNGLKKEEPIDTAIGWKPTFHMRPSRVLMVAVEVSDHIFPQILQIAADDIGHYNYPISIYQACSLDVYQKDAGLKRVSLLRDRGFGLITVDDAGIAQIHLRPSPIGQYISANVLESELKTLTPRLKVAFRDAWATYETNIGQGLQAAGQIIEALVKCISEQAEAAKFVPLNTTRRSTASIIDALYAAPKFKKFRATLGGARSFVRAYRNIASHPATTPQLAAAKIKSCKAGFLEALRLARDLRSAIQELGFHVVIH
jgi:hypothetical protein